MATTARTRRKDTANATESPTPEPTASDASETTPNGDTSAPAPEPTASDASETTPNGDTGTPAPEPTAPVSPATRARDRMKVTLVGEILGEHSGGITAVDLVTASELQPTVVARVLTAMEATGAAYRKVDDSGAETWYRGESDLEAVDLATAPADSVCPTCKRGGWRVNVGGTGGTRRRTGNGNGNGEPRVNADGNAPLRKGELTGMVRDFLSARPGKPYSDSDIARELREIHSRPSISSGAVRENLTKMIVDKQTPVELANPSDPHDRRVIWAA